MTKHRLRTGQLLSGKGGEETKISEDLELAAEIESSSEILPSYMLRSHLELEDTLELPIFDLNSILIATDNFSLDNKLGQGGFGPVYKAWQLWHESKEMELLDEALADSFSSSAVKRCIHDYAEHRPSMSTVVSMLSSETELPQPKQPILFQSALKSDRSESNSIWSTGQITESVLEGR
ncbi:hypothetical protein SCA6_020273 [Theobroma cacao]